MTLTELRKRFINWLDHYGEAPKKEPVPFPVRNRETARPRGDGKAVSAVRFDFEDPEPISGEFTYRPGNPSDIYFHSRDVFAYDWDGNPSFTTESELPAGCIRIGIERVSGPEIYDETGRFHGFGPSDTYYIWEDPSGCRYKTRKRDDLD